MTEKLKEYLKNTNPEQLVQDWNDLSKYNNGIDVREFLKYMTKEEFYKEYLEYKLFPESDQAALEEFAREFEAGLLRVTRNNNHFISIYRSPFTMDLFSKLLTDTFKESDKSIFEIMAMYKTEVENDLIMNVIKPGDIVLFTDETYGLVISDNGDNVIISCNGSYDSDDDIAEIRRPNKPTVVINDSNFQSYELIWPVKQTCFLGTSYQADEEQVSMVSENLKDQGYEVVEWNQLANMTINNIEIKQAQKHVIVPPSSFKYNHIIGLGLYNQIQTRASVDKTTEIYDEVSDTIKPIKQVIKINNATPKQFAIVVI